MRGGIRVVKEASRASAPAGILTSFGCDDFFCLISLISLNSFFGMECHVANVSPLLSARVT